MWLGCGKDDQHRTPSKMTSSWLSVELFLGAIGAILIVLGALMATLWEEQIDARFQKEMVLTNTSAGVEEWAHPGVSITTLIYFWNWTNAADIGQDGYKPVLEQVGPYTFSEEHFKANIVWNDNGTVTYNLKKFFYFRPDLSNGSLSDNITSVNVIAATLSEMSQDWGRLALMSLSMGLVSQQQKISWTHTVAELTFDGFSNPIQSFGSILSSATKDKFGFFYDFNGTVQADVYTMNTGANDIYSIGNVESVNYQTTTPAHSGECSKMSGSFGEMWAPHLTPQSVLSLYAPDMCRPNRYYYEGESEHRGISTLVFSSTPMTFDNGTLSKENECFCDARGCEPSGLHDLRSCKFGAPVFMSLPHLHLADPVYRDAVIGMTPSHERHKFAFEMEPRTAIPMKVAARVQLNVKLRQNKGLSTFRNIKTVLVPVFWMETVYDLPATHTSDIQLLLTIIACGPYVCAVVIVIGSVLFFCVLCRRINASNCCRARKHKVVIVDGTERSSLGLIGRSKAISSANSSDLSTQCTKYEFISTDGSQKDHKVQVSTNNNPNESERKLLSNNEKSNDILDVRL